MNLFVGHISCSTIKRTLGNRTTDCCSWLYGQSKTFLIETFHRFARCEIREVFCINHRHWFPSMFYFFVRQQMKTIFLRQRVQTMAHWIPMSSRFYHRQSKHRIFSVEHEQMLKENIHSTMCLSAFTSSYVDRILCIFLFVAQFWFLVASLLDRIVGNCLHSRSKSSDSDTQRFYRSNAVRNWNSFVLRSSC